jgi:diguanylate cyclase (GGDEF)-like protein
MVDRDEARPVGSAFHLRRVLEQRLEHVGQATVERLGLLNELARAIGLSDPSRALELATEARALAEQLDHRDGGFEARANEVLARAMLSELDEAWRLVTALAEEASPARPEHVARCRSLRAMLQQRMGDLPSALASAMSALEVLRTPEARASYECAAAHNLVGNLLTKLADPPGAIEHYGSANEIFAQLGRFDVVAVVVNNLGMAYLEAEQFDQAIETLSHALAMMDATPPTYLRAAMQGNLALARIRQKRAAEALSPLLEALAACEALDARRGVGTMHHNLGLAHRQLGDLSRAALHFDKSVAVRESLGEELDLAETRVAFALLLRERGEVERASELLRNVLEGKGSTAWSRLRADAHYALYELRRAERNFAEALDHHVAFHEESRAFVDDRARLRQQALAVRHETRLFALEREVMRTRGDELVRLARVDALTGLGNRRSLDERFAFELRRARSLGRPASIALLDVDRFKELNDTHSHLVGDEVLRQLARLLEAQLRTGDIVGRFGGEEFAFIFPGATLESAQRACERLRAAIERHVWQPTLPAGYAVTGSFGVADVGTSVSVNDWLARADRALYRAKREGRNRVCVDSDGNPGPN